MAKETYTRKEVLWLLKRQKKKTATAVGRLPWKAGDEAIFRKLRTIKLVSLSEVKNMSNHKK